MQLDSIYSDRGGERVPGSSLTLTDASVDRGDRVRDREAPAPDQCGVALAICDTAAEDVYVDAIGTTVAADNPEYPADDPVIEVVWDDQIPVLAPLGTAEPVADLHAVAHARSDLSIYHFPASRLVPEDAISDVPPGNLQSIPYHERTFDGDANRSYINEIASRGYLRSLLVARETAAGLELVEGHKRRWAAEQAGLETVAVRVVDLDDWEAAVHYAQDHLPGLDAETAQRTRDALADRWGDRVEELLTDSQLSRREDCVNTDS